MQQDKQGKAFTRIALATGAPLLAGCVPSAYVYDDLPAVHSRSVGAPYPPAYSHGYPGSYGYPGYYGYPRYNVPPGYYGYSPYPPRVVYYDHDHRGDDCRHPGHSDGRRGDDRDRHDRDGRDRPPQDRDGRPGGRPPGGGPAMPPPQWRNPPRGTSPAGPGSPPQVRPNTDDRCAGPGKCRLSAAARSEPAPRGMRAPRVPTSDEQGKSPGARKDVD